MLRLILKIWVKVRKEWRDNQNFLKELGYKKTKVGDGYCCHLEKTKAVVIKAQDYKENDKLVWLYTEEFGKVTAIARGAKKSKSRLFALTLPLCYADYVLFKGKNLFNLQEGKIENSFQGF